MIDVGAQPTEGGVTGVKVVLGGTSQLKVSLRTRQRNIAPAICSGSCLTYKLTSWWRQASQIKDEVLSPQVAFGYGVLITATERHCCLSQYFTVAEMQKNLWNENLPLNPHLREAWVGFVQGV